MANENLFSGIIQGLANVQMQKYQQAQEIAQRNRELQQKMQENEMFYQQTERRRPAEFQRKLEEQKQLKMQENGIAQQMADMVKKNKIKGILGEKGPDGLWRGTQLSQLANEDPMLEMSVFAQLDGYQLPIKNISPRVKDALNKKDFEKALAESRTDDDWAATQFYAKLQESILPKYGFVHDGAGWFRTNEKAGTLEPLKVPFNRGLVGSGSRGGTGKPQIQKREIRDPKTGKVVGAKWVDMRTGEEVDQTGKPVQAGGWLSQLAQSVFPGAPKEQEIDEKDYKQTERTYNRLAKAGELTPLGPDDQELFNEASGRLREYDRRRMGKNKPASSSGSAKVPAPSSTNPPQSSGNPAPAVPKRMWDDALIRLREEKKKRNAANTTKQYGEGVRLGTEQY